MITVKIRTQKKLQEQLNNEEKGQDLNPNDNINSEKLINQKQNFFLILAIQIIIIIKVENKPK